jgi:pyruvate dehydrogenase E2 component (dihydrolipoamide acetyltransferase)
VPTPVKMPQLGETVVEGTIVKWLKGQGDQVERDEPLFEISTDKVDTEVPSPVAGTLQEIKVQEGETVSVGTELATIEEAGGDGQAAQPQEQAEPQAQQEPKEADEGVPAEPETKEPATSGASQDAEGTPEGATMTSAEAPGGQEAEAPAGGATVTSAASPQAPEAAGRGTGAPQAGADAQAQPAAERGPRSHILSPLVRRLAEENDIDLGQVRGTGTGGRITKKDIMAFIESGGAAAAPAPAATPPQLEAVPQPAQAPAPERRPGDREGVRPISHIRKRIAENMVASLQSSARAWNMVDVNMENLVRLRERAKERFKEKEGISLTYMPFLARSVCEALQAFPDVNARLNLEEGTATYHNFVNLGIAVAYEEGLIVPVVRGADEMNVVGLARAINDLATRARSKKLKPDEVHGGTFTITNPGPFGSIISVPIMNPGETAILAFDAIEKRPVVVDDAIAIRHMVYLSMSWDHRMIDGAVAAQFLGRLKQNLETWDFTPEVQAYLG